MGTDLSGKFEKDINPLRNNGYKQNNNYTLGDGC